MSFAPSRSASSTTGSSLIGCSGAGASMTSNDISTKERTMTANLKQGDGTPPGGARMARNHRARRDRQVAWGGEAGAGRGGNGLLALAEHAQAVRDPGDGDCLRSAACARARHGHPWDPPLGAEGRRRGLHPDLHRLLSGEGSRNATEPPLRLAHPSRPPGGRARGASAGLAALDGRAEATLAGAPRPLRGALRGMTACRVATRVYALADLTRALEESTM